MSTVSCEFFATWLFWLELCLLWSTPSWIYGSVENKQTLETWEQLHFPSRDRNVWSNSQTNSSKRNGAPIHTHTHWWHTFYIAVVIGNWVLFYTMTLLRGRWKLYTYIIYTQSFFDFYLYIDVEWCRQVDDVYITTRWCMHTPQSVCNYRSPFILFFLTDLFNY